MHEADCQQGWLFPDLETLTAGLTDALKARGIAHGPVTVFHRFANPFESTFPSKVVRCRLANGIELSLFCKYGVNYGYNTHGHRGGVAYESEVYRQILQISNASAPTFYGAFTDRTNGQKWLILEYLAESVYVSKTPEPAAMSLAACWIGQFHAINEARLSSLSMPFLKVYDAQYYMGWAWRTIMFGGQLVKKFRWPNTLSKQFENLVSSLLASSPTVIHGEYYPKRILFQGGDYLPYRLGVGCNRGWRNRPC